MPRDDEIGQALKSLPREASSVGPHDGVDDWFPGVGVDERLQTCLDPGAQVVDLVAGLNRSVELPPTEIEADVTVEIATRLKAH